MAPKQSPLRSLSVIPKHRFKDSKVAKDLSVQQIYKHDDYNQFIRPYKQCPECITHRLPLKDLEDSKRPRYLRESRLKKDFKVRKIISPKKMSNLRSQRFITDQPTKAMKTEL